MLSHSSSNAQLNFSTYCTIYRGSRELYFHSWLSATWCVTEQLAHLFHGSFSRWCCFLRCSQQVSGGGRVLPSEHKALVEMVEFCAEVMSIKKPKHLHGGCGKSTWFMRVRFGARSHGEKAAHTRGARCCHAGTSCPSGSCRQHPATTHRTAALPAAPAGTRLLLLIPF